MYPGLGGDQGVIKISKTVLSGAAPGHIREQTEGLAPAQLRELAVQLAADPDLTVSVITYDGSQEVEVLYTGPPHRTEDTIDRWKFSRRGPAASARRGVHFGCGLPKREMPIQRTAEILGAGA